MNNHVEAQSTVQIDQARNKDIAAQVEQRGVKFVNLVEDAKAADEDQHIDLGVLTAFRTHWKAALWSMAISTCIVMEGYDLVIVNSFYGQTAFIDKFGTFNPETGKKIITPAWQTGLSNSALCGEIIGLAINGWASERFGYRWVNLFLSLVALEVKIDHCPPFPRRTLMVALAFMFCAIFVPVFTPSLPILALGEVLQGIPWVSV